MTSLPNKRRKVDNGATDRKLELHKNFKPILPKKFTETIKPIKAKALKIKNPAQISTLINIVKPELTKNSKFSHLKIVRKASKSEILLLLPDNLKEIFEEIENYGEIIEVDIPEKMALTKEQNKMSAEYWPNKFKPNENYEFWVKFNERVGRNCLEKCVEFEEAKHPCACSQKIALFDKTGQNEIKVDPKHIPPVKAFQPHKILSFIEDYANTPHLNDDENYLLNGKIIVLDSEPCTMCAMALLHSRIFGVIFGRANQEFGGLVSKISLNYSDQLNHKFHVLRRIF